MAERPPLYGVLGAYASAEALRTAVHRLRAAGYRDLEAYTPFPVDRLAEDLGAGPDRLPRWALVGGLLGAALSYLLQYYAAVHAYPLNIGGRPLHSWPAFIPVGIEFGILGAALALMLGLLFCSRLPRLRHPLFAVPGFEQASQEGFFLCVRVRDADFTSAARDQLRAAGATSVQDVPP